MDDRPFARPVEILRAAGLRPTRQRLTLTKLLFENGHRHVTAEALHAEATAQGVTISLATVYNTLHQFGAANLLRSVSVDGQRTYFDTNTSDHHHFYYAEDGALEDIDGETVRVIGLEALTDAREVERVDVIVRVKGKKPPAGP